MQPPYTPAQPFAAFSRGALALRDSLVARARAQIGKRYRHGGETPTRGFDCSGLVAYVLASLDLRVPRTANAQAAVGSEVVRDTSELRPGDLLTFGRGKRSRTSASTSAMAASCTRARAPDASSSPASCARPRRGSSRGRACAGSSPRTAPPRRGTRRADAQSRGGEGGRRSSASTDIRALESGKSRRPSESASTIARAVTIGRRSPRAPLPRRADDRARHLPVGAEVGARDEPAVVRRVHRERAGGHEIARASRTRARRRATRCRARRAARGR